MDPLNKHTKKHGALHQNTHQKKERLFSPFHLEKHLPQLIILVGSLWPTLSALASEAAIFSFGTRRCSPWSSSAESFGASGGFGVFVGRGGRRGSKQTDLDGQESHKDRNAGLKKRSLVSRALGESIKRSQARFCLLHANVMCD